MDIETQMLANISNHGNLPEQPDYLMRLAAHATCIALAKLVLPKAVVVEPLTQVREYIPHPSLTRMVRGKEMAATFEVTAHRRQYIYRGDSGGTADMHIASEMGQAIGEDLSREVGRWANRLIERGDTPVWCPLLIAVPDYDDRSNLRRWHALLGQAATR
jgi:hypothetical protein